MNIAIQAQIKCPFFENEKGNLLCCEGFIDGTCMTTKFPSFEAKAEYAEKHCYKIDGGKCHLAKNLYEKYREIEKREERERIERIRIKLKQTG